MRQILLVGLLAAALVPAEAMARGRGFGGGMGMRSGPTIVTYGYPGWGGFGYGYGYGMGSYWGPWGPMYGPGFGTPNVGEVKLKTPIKDADVYIDGAFAGTAGKLKSVHLRPGSYQFEIRAVGRTPFQQRVYVVAGKKLELNPELRVEARP